MPLSPELHALFQTQSTDLLATVTTSKLTSEYSVGLARGRHTPVQWAGLAHGGTDWGYGFVYEAWIQMLCDTWTETIYSRTLQPFSRFVQGLQRGSALFWTHSVQQIPSGLLGKGLESIADGALLLSLWEGAINRLRHGPWLRPSVNQLRGILRLTDAVLSVFQTLAFRTLSNRRSWSTDHKTRSSKMSSMADDEDSQGSSSDRRR